LPSSLNAKLLMPSFALVIWRDSPPSMRIA
jgi:hypothetical protein